MTSSTYPSAAPTTAHPGRMHGRLGALLVVAGACSPAVPRDERAALEGFRDLEAGDVDRLPRRRRPVADRVRTRGAEEARFAASGSISRRRRRTRRPTRSSSERRMRTGEASQVRPRSVSSADACSSTSTTARSAATPRLFGGTEDLAAADIGMLFSLFAPVLRLAAHRRRRAVARRRPTPSRCRGRSAVHATALTRSPGASGSSDERGTPRIPGLDAVRVKSVALGNVRSGCRSSLRRRATGTPARRPARTSFIVNQLFEGLFCRHRQPGRGRGRRDRRDPARDRRSVPRDRRGARAALRRRLASNRHEPQSRRGHRPRRAARAAQRHAQVWDADGRVLRRRRHRDDAACPGGFPNSAGLRPSCRARPWRWMSTWKFAPDAHVDLSPHRAIRRDVGRSRSSRSAAAIARRRGRSARGASAGTRRSASPSRSARRSASAR